jgi:hypothetical protein
VQPLLLGGANSSRNVQQDPAILDLLKQFAGPVEAMKTTVAGNTRLLCTLTLCLAPHWVGRWP